MLRIFKLRNANGAELDLTNIGHLVLYDVGGLGYDTEPTMQRVGNHYAVLSDNLQQSEIEGYVQFYQPGAYKAFFDFAQFCQIKPLTLIYRTDAGTFYRDGLMRHVGKAEANGSVLMSDVVFMATTPYYRIVSQYNEGGGTSGKRYTYRYPYRYAQGASQSVTIESDSLRDCPTKIEIYGPAANPTWRHYLNNRLVATGAVNATIESGRKLIIDTTTIPYRIIQTDMADNFVSDLYQQSDFETKRFIRLREGYNLISVAQTGIGIIRIFVEARLEYATV